MTDFPLTDDVVLLNSGDTARKGMYVEFGLFHHPDGPILPGMSNPFNELSQGREKGQRFRITITPLAEDETTPAEPQDARDDPEGTETPEEGERPKGGERAKRAGILCGDVRFQHWLEAKLPVAWRGADALMPEKYNPEMVAAEVLREFCGVESRALLDHYDESARRFDKIAEDFYRSQRGQSDEEVAKQARRG